MDNYLETLSDIRKDKNIDEIAELFLSIITMYGLTMDEVSGLSYYLVDTTLQAQHNKQFIRDNFSINVDELDIDGKLAIHKALIATYIDKVKRNG